MLKLNALFFVFITLVSNAQADTKQDLAAQVLRKTDTYTILATFPEQLRVQAGQDSPVTESREASKNIVNKIITGFDVSTEEGNLTVAIVNRYSADELSDILKWVESPLGQKFAVAERGLDTVEGRVRMSIYVQGLKDKPLPASRLTLMERFEKMAGLTETTMYTMKVMMLGLMQVNNAALEKSKQLSRQALRHKIDQQFTVTQAEVSEFMRQQILRTTYYIYRNISDQEMQAYINFLESDAGHKYAELGVTVADVFAEVFNHSLVGL